MTPKSSDSANQSMTSESPTQIDHNRIVFRSAIASRLLLLALIILWRSLVSPYDTSASINPNCLSSDHHQSSVPILFPRIAAIIEESIVWDSVYFVRIAQCGYEYEQSYAFLPLLPLCISFLSQTVFAPLVPLIGYRAVLGLSGYMLNNISYVFAAAYFYRLSVFILKDAEAAMRASLLFCFNPASIFYSSIYSESFYALLSIGGLCHLMSGSNNLATLWLALSGSARSNGVLNAGYICFQTMHRVYDAVFLKRHAYLAVQVLIAGALRCIFFFLPFITFQSYGYYNVCLGHFPDEIRPWCKTRLPLLYNYIQSHYWGVGFLNYFQVKQSPNFLLAFPILSLALCSIIHFAKLRSDVFWSLGFQASHVDKSSYPLLFNMEADTRSRSVDVLKRETFKISREEHTLRRRGRTIKGKDTVMLPLDNSSSENEQLAFCPAIVIPGVYYSDDKLLQSRIFSYADTQRHRLGPNYLQLPANAPKSAHHNNHHEGLMNFMHRDEEVNYFPSRFDSVRHAEKHPRPPPVLTGRCTRAMIEKENNFKQPGERYRSFPPDRQERFIRRVVDALSDPRVTHEIHSIWISYWSQADKSLGEKIASRLNVRPSI